MVSFEKAHILYLEDDPESVELVKFLLGVADITVTVVDSVEQVLDLAGSGQYDLFLLDGLLPSGYSFDICPELRAAAPDVPIVFYTALGFPAQVQKGEDAGADAYLLKPFMGDLAATLMKIIEDSKRTPYRPRSSPSGYCSAAP